VPLKAIAWGALRGVAIIVALLLLSLGGCAVDVTHDAGGGWHVSAGPFVFLLTLAALIYSWARRP
jgi:hypothetical protein